MLEKLMRMAALYDFYGALLTEKQRIYLEMHYLQDLSLSEIADEAGISRQAVHDILKRAEYILEEYESKLKLVERNQRDMEDTYNALLLLQKLPADIRQRQEISEAKQLLENVTKR